MVTDDQDPTINLRNQVQSQNILTGKRRRNQTKKYVHPDEGDVLKMHFLDPDVFSEEEQTCSDNEDNEDGQDGQDGQDEDSGSEWEENDNTCPWMTEGDDDCDEKSGSDTYDSDNNTDDSDNDTDDDDDERACKRRKTVE